MIAAEARVAAVAVSQAGAFTRAQAGAAGFNPAQIERRVRAGVWRRVLPRVYCHAATPESPCLRQWGAVLWAGADCALSHVSAASIWGLRVPPGDRPELIVAKVRAPRVAGVIVHRVARVDALDVVRVGGMAVTAPVRTIIDLAAVLAAADLDVAVAHACARRVVTVRAVLVRLDAIGTVGRPGTAHLRALLVMLGSGGVDSSARMAG